MEKMALRIVDILDIGHFCKPPERDLQYHLASSLTSMLLGAREFFCKQSEAGTPYRNKPT
jgi:hypothetical protein